MIERIDLSVIIPVYNSANIFPVLHDRLVKVLSNSLKSYEIIAVVDGCSDKSSEVIEKHCKMNPNLKMIEFSRNFGHQAAISAGLQFSSGKMVVIMDDDLEDPPELISKFIEKAQDGYDVVYGIRRKRKVSFFRRLYYYLFYRVLNRIADVDMPHDAGDFCLMKRPVVDALNSMPETNRYLRGMRSWLGFRQAGIDYEREQSLVEESRYSLYKYIKFALDGILSFSYKPLMWVSIFGFIVASLSFVLGTRLIAYKLLGRVADVPGWASVLVSILFIGGVQLISIGILGQYIARIYDESKQRPKFIVKRSVGLDIPKEESCD